MSTHTTTGAEKQVSPKVTAATVAAFVVGLLAYVLKTYFDLSLDTEATAMLTGLIVFAAGYLTPDNLRKLGAMVREDRPPLDVEDLAQRIANKVLDVVVPYDDAPAQPAAEPPSAPAPAPTPEPPQQPLHGATAAEPWRYDPYLSGRAVVDEGGPVYRMSDEDIQRVAAEMLARMTRGAS